MRDPAEQLAQARENLTEITQLAGLLLDQAMYGGHDGHLDAANELPGRDAMVMLGPAANYEAWAAQVATRVRYTRTKVWQPTDAWIARFDGWVTDDAGHDPDPPIGVLTAWEDMWRLHLNLLTAPVQRPSIERSATFLHEHMGRMSRITRPSFDNFANDIGSLHGRLEAILSAGERDEAGAPCLKCRATLIRRAQPRSPVVPRRYCTGHGQPAVCRWPARWDLDECVRFDRGGLRDVWDCPRCKREYSYAEYWNAVRASYRANAPALPADDIAEQLGVAKGSIRGWAALGKVRRRGRNLDGRVLYDVADVKRAAGIEAA